MATESNRQQPQGGRSTTSLEGQETTAGDLWQMIPDTRRTSPEFACQRATTQEQDFRHSGWADDRLRIFRVMIEPGFLPGARLERFASCGSAAWFEHSPSTGRVRVSANHCHDRWCQVCCRARAVKLRGQMQAACKGDSILFLTFTLRNVGNLDVAAMYERLMDCWRLLRQRKEFKEHLDGGAAVPEFKLGKFSGAWHVHLHVLAVGRFWDQRAISRLWLAVTGDSSVVHVTRVWSDEQIAEKVGYVIKYATKPVHSDVIRTPHLLRQCILAMKGARLVNFFGTWKGIKELDQEQPTDWQSIGPLARVLAGAEAGDPYLLAVLRAWATDEPLTVPAGVPPASP